jgi:hypothetical protein
MAILCPHCQYDFADNDPAVEDPAVRQGLSFSLPAEVILIVGQVIAGLSAVAAFIGAIYAVVGAEWWACFGAVCSCVLCLALLVTFRRVQKLTPIERKPPNR